MNRKGFMFAALAVVILGLVCVAGYSAKQSVDAYEVARSKCLTAGYPKMTVTRDGRFFCERIVNGTDEVREVTP